MYLVHLYCWDWVYTHFTICLIAHALCKNELFLKTLFTLSYVSAHGLIGIHGFYISTGYNLLREFAVRILDRYHLKRQPLVVYVFADGIIHVLPSVVMQQLSHRCLLSGDTGFVAAMLAWLCHVTYTPTLLHGSFDPCGLYKVQQRRNWQIGLAWSMFSATYFLTAYHIFMKN